MERYDPFRAPDPDEWLGLDEQERIDLVLQYHRRARVKLPNVRLHAVMHVVVENQGAMGNELPVGRTLDRLRAEGLDRHEAVHAVGSVLAGHMYDLMKGGATEGDPNERYWARLKELTAEGWRNAASARRLAASLYGRIQKCVRDDRRRTHQT